MKNRKYLFLLIPSLFLLLPLIAMQFTNEVNWTLMDFVIAGILLFGTALLIELVIRKIRTSKYKVAIIVFILVAFLVTWTELAVGIFNTPLSGN